MVFAEAKAILIGSAELRLLFSFAVCRALLFTVLQAEWHCRTRETTRNGGEPVTLEHELGEAGVEEVWGSDLRVPTVAAQGHSYARQSPIGFATFAMTDAQGRDDSGR